MSSSALLVKAALTALSDERFKKSIGWTIVAICSPIIILFVIFCGLLSGAANHNQNTIKLVFNNQAIPNNMPLDYKAHIEDMRRQFEALDLAIADTNQIIEGGESLDSIRIKAIFYSLYFGEEKSFVVDYPKFVDSFVNYQANENLDEGSEELQNVAVPIEDMSIVYKNLSENMGKDSTYEDMSNALEIYYKITYNTSAPTEMDESKEWEGWVYELTQAELENLHHNLPVGEKGGEIVKLAMQRLGNPYSQEKRGQGNYTDCSYLTMWCYKQIGIYIPGTAAEQAKYCFENRLTIAKKDLMPGDLVFWSHKPNGRFMNITHVGIYAGQGKVVDASSTIGKVVYRDLFQSNKQILYGRPQIRK